MENLKYEGTIDLGEFKNVSWHQRSDNRIFLTVTESDTFREIENNYDFKGTDELAEEDRDYLDGKVDELAEGISKYLNSIGVENEIYDDQIGYGQEIINLVVAIYKNDFSKLK